MHRFDRFSLSTYAAPRRALLAVCALLALVLPGCNDAGTAHKLVDAPDGILREAAIAAFVDPDAVRGSFTIEALVAHCDEDFHATTDLDGINPDGPFVEGVIDNGDKGQTPFALELRPTDDTRESYRLIRFGAPTGRPVPPTDADWRRVLDDFIDTQTGTGGLTPEYDRFTRLALKGYIRAQMDHFINHARFAGNLRDLERHGAAPLPRGMNLEFLPSPDGSECLMTAHHGDGQAIFGCLLPDADIFDSRERIVLATIRLATADPIDAVRPLLTGFVDLARADASGRTAFDLAEEKAFPQTLRALVDYTPPES
ncbi:hypothetical protein GGQ74_002236 [Desulfobaculum xiamenense]|uniref:Uncharacterized protein n=1 Tax=Desulfobaculum xiamenense TaxID=995050 RepID=A0A846QQD9_9BACT|nr:hypothetical protein [Desulfobaculum xiamenense]NJB68563.1 hypothetical protein [Desulfobaculum xiamenense]